MPMLGLGVWQVPNGPECVNAVRWAHYFHAVPLKVRAYAHESARHFAPLPPSPEADDRAAGAREEPAELARRQRSQVRANPGSDPPAHDMAAWPPT